MTALLSLLGSALLLALAHTGAGPAGPRLVATLATLWLLPGVALLRLSGRAPREAAPALAWAYAGSVGWLSLAAAVCFALRLPPRALADLTAALLAISGVAMLARRGRAPAPPAAQPWAWSGLEAVLLVANKIALGQLDSGIAGGVDTTSDAPLAVNAGLREILIEANRATSLAGRLRQLTRVRPGHLVPEVPRNAEPRTGLSMGEHAALTAVEWGITRQEQDELAVASHHNLAAAYERGFYDDLVTPYLGLERDDNLRPDTSVDKLASLRTVFGHGDTATMTAGNSTPLTDGASVVLLATPQWAAAHRLPVLAYLVTGQTAAVDYVHGGEGLLMAPAYAVPRMLSRLGLGLADFDLYELHEAFASQVLATLKAWQDPDFCVKRLGLDGPLGSIDRARLNVNGGSLASGHPFAATGGRIVAGLAKALAERGGGRGLISICAAGGQGVVAVLER
ncbi:MAG TPA: acetyl-CoA C-acetyltransferase [Candidatus Saccharimonadales bacterium]|nr:acetyl-CoA C-acetyltransferase [Candidatus Saccharimonadales bacterium]